jgi:hypothetical protein
MILITDIDHTLADATWRDEFRPVWDDYHKAAINDNPYKDAIALINTLHKAGWTIVCITSRPEKWRQLTTEWLLNHAVHVDQLLMRPNDDFRPSPEVKADLAKPFERFNPVMCMDDREDCIASYGAHGFTTLLVHHP